MEISRITASVIMGGRQSLCWCVGYIEKKKIVEHWSNDCFLHVRKFSEPIICFICNKNDNHLFQLFALWRTISFQ